MADAAHAAGAPPLAPAALHDHRVALHRRGRVDAHADAEERRVLQDGPAGGRRPLARRHPHVAHRRRGRARLDPRHRRRRRLQAHRGRRDGAGRPPRHRADAVQELRAGRRRRALERHARSCPTRSSSSTARRTSRRRTPRRPARRIRSDVREGAARLRDARDRHRGGGARRRDARRRHPAAPAGAAAARAPLRVRRAARRGRRVRRSWSRRCSRTTSRSRTSPTTSRARRPGSTRSPRRGARSKVRSCCGRSRSRCTSAFTTWHFRKRADGSARRVGDARAARRARVLLRADAVPGEPVQA